MNHLEEMMLFHIESIDQGQFLFVTATKKMLQFLFWLVINQYLDSRM